MKLLKIIDSTLSVLLPTTIFFISLGFLFSPSKSDWNVNVWITFPEDIYDNELKALFLLPLFIFTFSMLIKSIYIYIKYQSHNFSILLIVSFGFSIVAIAGLLIFQRIDFFFLNAFSVGFYIMFIWFSQQNNEQEARKVLNRLYVFIENNIGIVFIATMLYTSMFIAIMTDAGFQIASADRNAIASQIMKIFDEQKEVRSRQAPCFGDKITVNYGMGFHKVFLSQEYDTKCAFSMLAKDLIEKPIWQRHTIPLYDQFDIDEYSQRNDHNADVVIAYNIMRAVSFLSEEYNEYNRNIGLFFQNAEINSKICQDFIGGQSYCLVREK